MYESEFLRDILYQIEKLSEEISLVVPPEMQTQPDGRTTLLFVGYIDPSYQPRHLLERMMALAVALHPQDIDEPGETEICIRFGKLIFEEVIGSIITTIHVAGQSSIITTNDFSERIELRLYPDIEMAKEAAISRRNIDGISKKDYRSTIEKKIGILRSETNDQETG